MRIIFVRHGHPNYKDDCLTELGHKQAEAAAKRLASEKIDRIFSSSCGRARETAEHIAAVHGLDVELLDFMREISWGARDGGELYMNGHPWRTVDQMVRDGRDLLSTGWRTEDPFSKNKISDLCDKLGNDLDEWLASLGLVREGKYYRIQDPKYDTVVLASHGGSSSVALAHIFNLPFPFVCAAILPDFTAITVVTFKGENGETVPPRFEIANDANHIKGLETENVIER